MKIPKCSAHLITPAGAAEWATFQKSQASLWGTRDFHSWATFPTKCSLPLAGGEKGQPLDEGRPTTGQSPALSPGEKALGAGHGGCCRHQAGQQWGQFRGATRGGRQGGAKENGKGERNEQREERRAAPGGWTAGQADSPPAPAQHRQRSLGLGSPRASGPF